jgi:hypothetical protein
MVSIVDIVIIARYLSAKIQEFSVLQETVLRVKFVLKNLN